MRLHIVLFASLCSSVSIIPRQSSPCGSKVYLCCNRTADTSDLTDQLILESLGIPLRGNIVVGLNCMKLLFIPLNL